MIIFIHENGIRHFRRSNLVAKAMENLLMNSAGLQIQHSTIHILPSGEMGVLKVKII